MVVAIIAGLLALAVMAKGLHITLAEQRLARRLVPVAARVTDQGRNLEVRALPSSDARGNDVTGQIATAEQAGTLHGPRNEHVYTGTWEYVVDGRTYQGMHEANAPVFPAEDLPPNAITVHYDSANHGVSRLYPGADTSAATAWFIFAGVIVAVGAVMVAVAGL